jgi:hemolysin activation/secretion protein
MSTVKPEKHYKTATLAIACAASLFWPCWTAAQQVRPPAVLDPGVIDRLPPEPPRDFKPKPDAPELTRPAPLRPETVAPTEMAARLERIRFEGNTLIKTEELEAVAESYLRRPFTARDLAALKRDLTELYRARGYFLTQAITPSQDLAGGVLRVVIVEVRAGAVKVEAGDLVRPRVVNEFSRRLAPGDPLREAELESQVLDLNDLSGVRASVNLQPGEAPATTDLLFALAPADEDVQRVSLDNLGSKLTGEYVARARLQKSNLLGLGDALGVSASVSDEGMWAAGVDLRTPIGIRNLFLEADYSHSTYDVVGVLAALDNSGDSDRLSLGLSSNLLNSRNLKLTGRGGMEVRRHRSDLAGVPETRDDITELFLEGSVLYRPSETSVLFGALRVIQGIDAFGASDPGDPLLSRALADPQSLILRPVAIGNFLPYPGGSLRVSLTGQWADEVLVSSDLFSIGGYGSVRGFEPSVLAAERGLSGSVELSHALPPQGRYVFLPSVYLDAGTVSSELPLPAGLEKSLTSVGAGLEVLAKFFPQGDTRLRLDYAFPIGHYDLLDTSGRFYAVLSQIF